MMNNPKNFAFVFSLVVLAAPFAAPLQAAPFWPADAKVYFVSPKNGDVVTGKVSVVMGLKGLGVAPAGVEHDKTGHHHILVDSEMPKGSELETSIPADEGHRHFGGGQTETTLDLKPGTHTLQLLVGDNAHVPHDPPLVSEKITITVK